MSAAAPYFIGGASGSVHVIGERLSAAAAGAVASRENRAATRKQETALNGLLLEIKRAVRHICGPPVRYLAAGRKTLRRPWFLV
jgi:hypothetical protein